MSQYPIRRARGYRIAAAAVVALVMAGLFAGVLYGSWGSVSRQAAAAAAERQGLGRLQAGVRLLAALGVGESAAAGGRKVDTAAITAAEAEVATATAGTSPGVAGRWQDLHVRIGGLLRKPATMGDQSWADAVGLADDLLASIAGAVDPDVATNSLLDAIVRPLPAAITYAGRAVVASASSATTTASGFPASQAQYQVALAAADVNADLRAGDLGDGDTIGGAEDAFTTAVSTFTAPSSVDPVTGSTDAATVATATAVQTAALNLATALIGRADLLLAARQDALQGDQHRYLGATIGLVLCALALLWLLTPARNRGGDLEASDEATEAQPDARGAIDPTALIDARDLLLEELVHIGRGVRTPTRGSDDDAQ